MRNQFPIIYIDVKIRVVYILIKIVIEFKSVSFEPLTDW